MNTPLETILSQRGEAVSEQTEEQVTQQPATEGESQTEQVTEGQSESDGDGNRVPVAALQAERAKVKRYTEEVADFRKSNEALQRQVGELLQRVPVPRAEQPQVPDQFEDFPNAARHAVRPEIDDIKGSLMAVAEMTAQIKYGDEKVSEADKAFSQAVQNRTIDPADYQKVLGSRNIYAAAVQWHQQQQAKAEIGEDLVAYKERVKADLRKELEAETNGGNGQQEQKPAAVMPSNFATARNVGNRSGPAWGGPAPINDIFARKRVPG